MLACALLLALTPPAWAFERVLALAPHVCEMLYALGVEERIVGAVDYCDHPPAAEALPRVGGYTGVNVEAALRLRPDLAIAMDRGVKGVAKLEDMGVRIVVSHPDSIEAMMADMLRLGRLLGVPARARRLVARMRQRLERVRAAARQDRQTGRRVRVFYELWNDPLMTVGRTSFISSLIREAGGENVFAGVPVETPKVGVEAVMRARPQLIVIPLERRSREARERFWKRWLGDVRVVAIDPDLLHRPGPRLLDGLEALRRALAARQGRMAEERAP